MASTKRLKAATTPTPQTREEAEQFLQDIGDAQRDVARIEADMNDQLSDVKRVFEEQAQPINQIIDEKLEGLMAYCNANRDQLLPGKKKSAQLATGEIGYRKNPDKVSIRGAEQVIENIKQLKLKQFLRTREEVNKEAMLVDDESKALAKTINGVSITSSEQFFVKPFESELEKAVTQKVA